jgi:chemotaxis protein MotB
MARMLTLIGLTLGVALTGCVSSDQYKALKLERDNLAEQLTTSQRTADQKAAEADALKRQVDQLGTSAPTQAAMLSNLQQQNTALQTQLDDANRRIEEALKEAANRPTGGSALSAPLTSALNQFATENPDLVDFNSAQGIVKFKSDVTFAPGEADITPAAREVIKRFSVILNSSAAASYELMVAGHTDDTPVHNPRTLALGNKDNWYLSCHRAISVAEALQQDGVNPARIGATGFADRRPIASNATEAGKKQNRRVEVLILPNTIHGSAQLASHPEGPSKAITARTAAKPMNKDDGAQKYNK